MTDTPHRIGVILANGRSSIWGVGQTIPTSLLQICGKPLLAQRIDEFRDAGVQRLIVLTDEQRAIEEARISLDAFSLDLDIHDSNDIDVDIRSRLLLVTAEKFSEPVVKVLDELSNDTVILSRTKCPIAATVSGHDVTDGLKAMRGETNHLANLQSTLASVNLESVSDYIQTNLDVLSGRLAVPRISGLKVAPNVHLEWVLSAKPANIKGSVHIGDNAVLHPTARVKDCVIGRKATILPRAKLERCVVLPGATVPEDAHYVDAVVTQTITVFSDASETAKQLERFARENSVR